MGSSKLQSCKETRIHILAGKLADVDVCNWWCIKVDKQAEILIDKYYSCVKVIHKVVLDIY